MSITLADGRLLEIEVSGPEDGIPFVFHHGTPGCSHQARRVQRATAERGLRLVTYSRAGYRGSSRHEGRSVADVVPDIVAVVDHLGADRFVVGGASGGGPHALATGALLPDRVAGVLCIAGVAPYDADGLDFLAGMGEQNVQEFGAALAGESELRPFLDAELPGLQQADAAEIVQALSTLLPPCDVAVLTDEVGEDSAAGMRGALSGGVDGWLDDDLAFTRDWGFALSDIQVPTFVWQGREDLMVPFAHGEWLAAHVPGAEVRLHDGEGHLSISVGKLEEMLDELVRTLR